LPTWAKIFGKGWSIQKVRTFFNILKNNNMILIEGLRKTTRLTICNFTTYPYDITDRQQTDNRQITDRQHQLKKEKKDNKEKNNINIISSEDKKNDKNWRNNFEIYLLKMDEVYNKLITDQIYISKQSVFYPGIDIVLSLKKAHDNFWATPAGWKHKKKTKTNEIDWVQTFTNAINLNKVYLPRQTNIINNNYQDINYDKI
jgi:hypothetical protein